MAIAFKVRLAWRPSLDAFVAPLEVAAPWRLRLDRLSKGIDNAHIDVHLSPQFQDRATRLMRRMLEHDVATNVWGESPPDVDRHDLEAFRDSYTSMMEVAVDRARGVSSPDVIQLLQFATIKYLVHLVGEEIERLRGRLKRARSSEDIQSTGKALHLHERIVLLGKEQDALRDRVVRKLLRQISKVENALLGKLRKSVFGIAWPVPKPVLFNPLLPLPSLSALELFMHHYPAVCMVPGQPGNFSAINNVITDSFEDFLPTWLRPAPGGGGLLAATDESDDRLQVEQRMDQGGMPGFLELELLLKHALAEREYKEALYSWLDVPENMSRISLSVEPRRSFRLERPSGQFARLWPDRRWPKFQRALMSRLYGKVRRSGLFPHILSSYQVAPIWRDLRGKVPADLIREYLAGTVSRSKLQRRLQGLPTARDVEVVKTLDGARVRIRRASFHERYAALTRFLEDFCRLRRDLKYGYTAHRAMDRVRILERPEDIELSKANSSLYDYPVRSELEGEEHRIRNHVVIKADLRGSTEITARLRQRNLNPASHFSSNFFQPINALIETFGATKVFVEGDAVILGIFEYEDMPYQWLSVCNACGLARKIIEVVDAQNAGNRKHDLPELELGLGIAFSDEPPAFLYDGEQQIMISPAINRASELSNCSASLKHSSLRSSENPRGVEVVAPADDKLLQKGEEGLLRYNVNGIELDAAAFHKLKNEISLRTVEITLPGHGVPTRFHAGRYPDRKGAMHWIIVREAPVRIWIGNNLGTEERGGRRFYEVVANVGVLSNVQRHLKRGVASSLQPKPREMRADSGDQTRLLH